jgi:hypothetical protein
MNLTQYQRFCILIITIIIIIIITDITFPTQPPEMPAILARLGRFIERLHPGFIGAPLGVGLAAHYGWPKVSLTVSGAAPSWKGVRGGRY